MPTCVGLAFVGWCGTFAGAASAHGAMASHGMIWLAWIVAGWVVGRGGGWMATLPWIGLVVAVTASWALSPVPRAGTTALVLLPTFLILPRLFAVCWRGDEGRRAAALGLPLLVSVASGWALWGWLVGGTDGTSLPLGHHNLLATFLVTLLPVSALGLRGEAVRHRLASLAACFLGLAALLATRSLAGAMALVAILVVAILTGTTTWPARRRFAVGSVGLVVLAASAPRVLDVLRGHDNSTLARLAYWRAGWRGFLERPLLGWGPGSSHWTLHEHFQPVPGLHPADQIVADLHSLPLQLLYELGLVGVVALSLALAVTGRRLLRTPPADRPLRRAGLLGLLGAAVASLGGLPLSVTALPLALALAAGCVLAAVPAELRGDGVADPPRLEARVVTLLVAVVMAAWLVPRDRAHRDYERAHERVEGVALTDGLRIERLRAAVSRDPHFPLYRWRLALATGSSRLAYEAAEDARGLAALWLTAAKLDAEGDGRRHALEQVCRTSRFAAVAPYWLGPSAAARAVASQPWLLAATGWSWQTRDDAVERLVRDQRIEPQWRQDLQRAWTDVERPGSRVNATETRTLALSVDRTPSTSLSLFAFRRLPWMVRLAAIELDAEILARVEHLPSVWSLPTTEVAIFGGEGCGLGGLSSQQSERDASRRP